MPCEKRTFLGGARSLAVRKGQSFTRTVIPILTAALAAWSARALTLELGVLGFGFTLC